jgi:hypothetical protein
MTATTVAVRPRGAPRVWRCGFCAGGHHGSCPGAIWHQRKVSTGKDKDDYKIVPTLWKCLCEEPGHPDFPYCTVCKCVDEGEVNPELWSCFDPHACAARVELRRRNDPVWQKIQRAKSHAALKRRAQRLDQQPLLIGLAADQDEAIDRMHDFLDGLSDARKERGRTAPKKPKPRTGECECCGEPTRGGRFLPGHDAKLVSTLLERIRSGDDAAYAEMERRNWIKKIPAKLRKAV